MHRILIYHSIGSSSFDEAGAELYCVTEEKFKAQMRYVSELPGSRIVESSNSQTRDILGDAIEPENKPVNSQKVPHRGTGNPQTILITFDDGLLNNYTVAFKILKELGLKAYFFVLAAKLGEPDYISPLQLKEMKDAGMIIGSHGMHHKFLPELSDIELDYELKESKQILEHSLGCDIDYLSIPRGFCDNRIIDKAKEAGYKAVFASYREDSAGFVFGRISVKYNWNLAHFKNVLNNGLSYREKLEESVKTVSKKILGPRVYDRIRAAILSR